VQIAFPTYNNGVLEPTPDPTPQALTAVLRWTGGIGALLATAEMRRWFVEFLATPGLGIRTGRRWLGGILESR
jgi:hypothetical protein